MKLAASDLAALVMTGCAVLITGAVLTRGSAQAPRDETVSISALENWQGVVAGASYTDTTPGRVTIVEFIDFLCPACSQTATEIKQIQARYGDKVALAYRHFPIQQIHPEAFAASVAAECGGAQGRLGPVADAMLSNQHLIGNVRWSVIGELAQIPDVQKFEKCINDERFKSRVQRDLSLGRSIGVRGTPTFLVNGKLVMGAGAVAQLSEWIAAELR